MRSAERSGGSGITRKNWVASDATTSSAPNNGTAPNNTFPGWRRFFGKRFGTGVLSHRRTIVRREIGGGFGWAELPDGKTVILLEMISAFER